MFLPTTSVVGIFLFRGEPANFFWIKNSLDRRCSRVYGVWLTGVYQPSALQSAFGFKSVGAGVEVVMILGFVKSPSC